MFRHLRDRVPPARLGILQLFTGSFLISFSAVFVKIAHVGPTSAGFYRSLFGAVTLITLALVRREKLWAGRRPFLFATLAGGCFILDLWAWHRSILFVGPGLATILGNFQVFFMAAAGILLFGERATWRFLVSVPLAVAGLVMLVGIDWNALDAAYRTGVGFGLLTAMAYASYLLTLRKAQRSEHRLGALPNLAWISAVTAFGLWVVARLEGDRLHVPDTQTWVVLVAYGVVCQAFGWVIISRALRKVDASRTGLVLLAQPALTFVWDILLFHRPTTSLEASGALLALGAIYLGSTGRGREEPRGGRPA